MGKHKLILLCEKAIVYLRMTQLTPKVYVFGTESHCSSRTQGGAVVWYRTDSSLTVSESTVLVAVLGVDFIGILGGELQTSTVSNKQPCCKMSSGPVVIVSAARTPIGET